MSLSSCVQHAYVMCISIFAGLSHEELHELFERDDGIMVIHK